MSRLFLNALNARRYPLCGVGYKRTREHLLSWGAVLPPAVKDIKVEVSQQDMEQPISPHSGSWLFLYENIPQLRYHNPNVQFQFQATNKPESKISLTLDDGQIKSFNTTELRQKEIRTKIEEFIETNTSD